MPQSSRARITGAVYLAYFVTAVTALLFVGRHSPAGKPLGYVSDLLYAVLVLLLVRLLAGCGRVLAWLALAAGLAGCVFMVLGAAHPVGINPLLFFAAFCILTGVLIARATFLPHALGWLLIVAGIGWWLYFLPGLPHATRVAIQALGITAEAALMFWLLFAGVREDRWRAMQR